MNKNVVHCAELSEDFLKAFGFNYDSGVNKLEVIFEANKPAKVKVKFVDAPSSSNTISEEELGKFAEAIKDYYLVEV